MNAVFLQLSCRAKKNYYNSQGKKIKGNNKKKKNRKSLPKIQEIKGKFKPRLGMLNG